MAREGQTHYRWREYDRRSRLNKVSLSLGAIAASGDDGPHEVCILHHYICQFSIRSGLGVQDTRQLQQYTALIGYCIVVFDDSAVQYRRIDQLQSLLVVFTREQRYSITQ